jgi:hypothetical protein
LLRKVKPLYRLSEHERRRTHFCVASTTSSRDALSLPANTQLRYKEAMNALESRSPGTQAQFFLGYLERAAPSFRAEDRADELLSVELFGSRA